MQPIRDWMTSNPVTVKPLDSIAFARRVLLDKRYNQLVVVRDGEAVGIITDRDLRDAYPSVFHEAEHDLAGGPDDWKPEEVTVESVMTPEPKSLGPDATLAEAARIMRADRIGALPIVEDGKLVGLLTRSDVLDAYVKLDDERG